MDRLMGTTTRLLVLMSMAASALVLVGGPARACSCAQMSPTESLGVADAAFVGHVVEVADGGAVSDGEGDVSLRFEAALLTFEVEQVVEGDLPARVEVATPSSEAACGASFDPDRPSAVLVLATDGGWSTNLCLQQVSVPQLLRASEEEPRPPSGEAEPEPPSGGAPDSDLTSGVVGDGSDPGTRWGGLLLIVAVGTGGVLVARFLRRARSRSGTTAP